MKFLHEILINSHDGNYDNIVNIISLHFSQFKNSDVIIQKISENKSNVIVQWGNPELLVNAHLDTVKPVNGWNTSPYKLIEKNGNYYGLGTCDTKGNIYAISKAIKHIQPKNLMLLFSVDEESNSIDSGVTHFLKSSYAEKIKRAIVCEPTNNRIADSHMGYYSYYLKANTVSRHSSQTAYLHDNAIFKLGRYFEPLLNAGYNLGKIQGGSAGNVIASECSLHISIRSNDDYNNVFNDLKKIIDNDIFIEIKTVLPALLSKNNIIFSEKNGLYNNKLFQWKKKNALSNLEFWTEASLFNQKGIDSIIYGVGEIQQAHIANEFVSKSSLNEAIKFFIDVIKCENEK